MFKDLKVIELASVLAGPSAGMFFAELGAQVIKIENPKMGGDVTRSWKLPTEDPDSKTSAYFASANYSKTHLFKDLTSEQDKTEVLDLIANADVLISNFKKGSAEKLGMGHVDLMKFNPTLIQVNLKGFESYAKPAYDVVLQAETGWLSMTGSVKEIAKIPVAMIDLVAAHQIKECILMGLLKKERSGEGSWVELSLERSSLASLANQASNYLNEGHIAKPMGTLHPNIAPYGEILITSDDVKYVLAIGSDKQFSTLCSILDVPDLPKDPRFLSNKTRVINRSELIDLLKKLAKNLASFEFERSCNEGKVPIGRIKDMKEVLSSEIAQNMVLESEDGLKRISQLAFDKKQFSS